MSILSRPTKKNNLIKPCPKRHKEVGTFTLKPTFWRAGAPVDLNQKKKKLYLKHVFLSNEKFGRPVDPEKSSTAEKENVSFETALLDGLRPRGLNSKSFKS